ncbi:MAG: Bax inhibitor-1/YccA family protein, partial [Candidatus Fimimonas sp.]
SAYLWIQLAISAFCVAYATIMLLWDLQMADSVVNVGAEKKYEWQVAFSLVTTIVYMYVEILELLLRILMIFGKNRD